MRSECRSALQPNSASLIKWLFCSVARKAQANAVQFLQNAATYSRSLGVRVRRILTDNGPALRSKAFANACHQNNLLTLHS